MLGVRSQPKRTKRRAPRRARGPTKSVPQRRNQMIPHPMPINGFELRHSTVIRYTTNAAYNAPITFQNLLDTINFATTAIAPYNVFYAVKLRRVELWAVAAIGTQVSTSIIFNGTTVGVVGDQTVHTDVSMGIEPSHLSVRPKRESLESNWQLSSANSAFTLNVPTGTVVDVHLSFKGGVQGNNVAAQNASVGAVIGATFWRGLDGKAIAATVFITPVDVSQF